MTKPVAPSSDDLLAQLQASRRELGKATARSKLARDQAQAESMAQAARLAEGDKARALADEAERLQRGVVARMDVKA